MAKETTKKQQSERTVKKTPEEETPKKSPKTAVKESTDSADKTKKATKKSTQSEEGKSDKTTKKSDSVKEKTAEKTEKPKKSDKEEIKETDIPSGTKSDYKARKPEQEKKNIFKKSDKAVKKKKSDDDEENQYTPYKKKAKISFKGFLISFLIIALFLTLNQFILHIPGVPTWESVFSDETPSFSIPTGEMQVHFINVGQGDSALIVTEDKTILIDSGETEYGKTVIEYIEKLGISKLDIIIGSHPHSDHIGSMSQVVDKFDVDELILPKMTKDMIPDTVCYTDLIRSADKKKAKISYVRAGEKLEISEGCWIDILAPVSDYDDLNNYSIVCKLIHGENSFLFTGDIETSAEYDIVESGAELNVDVLKVPHHGSATSSSYKFLKTVRPTYIVISVGSPNDYGHPNKAVYDRYKEFNCKRYRTDVNGSIVFKSDGVKLTIETENKNSHV